MVIFSSKKSSIKLMGKIQTFILTIGLVFAVSNSASANDFAFEFGVRQHSVNSNSNAISTGSGMGFQFGGTAQFQFENKMVFRTGMLYTQRPFTTTISGVEYKVSANYLDVPLHIMYKFEDYAGIYFGVNLSLNVDATVTPALSTLKANSSLVPIVFGYSFKVAPQIGGSIYYEMASGDVMTGYSSSRAVGANVAISFE